MTLTIDDMRNFERIMEEVNHSINIQGAKTIEDVKQLLIKASKAGEAELFTVVLKRDFPAYYRALEGLLVLV